MGLVIIFSLITVLSAFGIVNSLKSKNLLGLVFAGGTFLVIGWFTVMTIIHQGFPTVH